ncbi:hypothetical protein [Vampirovibrio sp.]|uniref:hypothetical protein n=1 Tax=Vampirovibrio sp. TaxID=2717857 RepID=UPI00359334A6
MSLKPPYTPEPPNYQKSLELLNQLCEITDTILPLSTGQDLPGLNQLIFQRGELIEQCRLIQLKDFAPQQQESLQQKIDYCEKQDVEIEKNMRAFKEEIDSQLKHLKQSQTLLGKYQPGEIEGEETRSKNV